MLKKIYILTPLPNGRRGIKETLKNRSRRGMEEIKYSSTKGNLELFGQSQKMSHRKAQGGALKVLDMYGTI